MKEDAYTGIWINWSKGKYAGSTLTISKESGTVLIAFIALFIRFTGSHMWHICSFAMHQARSTSSDQDDFYHQLQVILRNGFSEIDVLWNLSNLSWARKPSSPTVLRSLPFFLIASFHMATFGAAGLFASRVLSSGDEISRRSSTCGLGTRFINTTDKSIIQDLNNAEFVSDRFNYLRSLSYSRECYENGTDHSAAPCNIYKQPLLSSKISKSAPCPFATGVCLLPAITIDSGHIESDRHLGINAPEADMISVRKLTTCAPLDAEKYSDGWVIIPESVRNLSINEYPIQNETWKGYKFGRVLSYHPEIEYTYYLRSFSRYFRTTDFEIYWVPYKFTAEPWNVFHPIQDLQVPQSDLTIVGLRNNVVYLDQVRDPFFSAQVETVGNSSAAEALGLNGTSLWRAKNGFTFLGCVEKYQFCSKQACSPLTGIYGISTERDKNPDLNIRQLAIFHLLGRAANVTTIDYALLSANKDVLLARDYKWSDSPNLLIASALPDDQWQREVINLHNVSMAQLQRFVADFASPEAFEIKPGQSSLDFIAQATPGTAFHDLCGRIIIRTTAYLSFSVVGLVLTIIFGVLIICTNASLPHVVGHFQMRSKSQKSMNRRLEWIETGALQLHRVACEGRGIGPWNNRESSVPRTSVVGQTFSLSGLARKRWPQDAESGLELNERDREDGHEGLLS